MWHIHKMLLVNRFNILGEKPHVIMLTELLQRKPRNDLNAHQVREWLNTLRYIQAVEYYTFI